MASGRKAQPKQHNVIGAVAIDGSLAGEHAVRISNTGECAGTLRDELVCRRFSFVCPRGAAIFQGELPTDDGLFDPADRAEVGRHFVAEMTRRCDRGQFVLASLRFNPILTKALPVDPRAPPRRA
jgi:hypothetical protein